MRASLAILALTALVAAVLTDERSERGAPKPEITRALLEEGPVDG